MAKIYGGKITLKSYRENTDASVLSDLAKIGLEKPDGIQIKFKRANNGASVKNWGMADFCSQVALELYFYEKDIAHKITYSLVLGDGKEWLELGDVRNADDCPTEYIPATNYGTGKEQALFTHLWRQIKTGADVDLPYVLIEKTVNGWLVLVGAGESE